MTLDLFAPRAPAAPPAPAPSIVSLDAIEEALRTHRTVTVGGATITLRPVTSAEDHRASERGDVGIYVEWEGKTHNAGVSSWGFDNANSYDQAVVAGLRLAQVQPWFQRAALTGPADPAALPGELTETPEGRTFFRYEERGPNREHPDLTDGIYVGIERYDGAKPPKFRVDGQATRPDFWRAQFNAVRVVPDLAAARAFALRWIPLAQAFVAHELTPENCPVRKWHDGDGCRECWWEPEGKRGGR